jgi:hypothetical protein
MRPLMKHVCAALPLMAAVLGATPAAVQAQAPASQPPQHQHDADAEGALFRARETSGTAWLPDHTPMYGIGRTWRGWHLMMHGTAFAQFLYEPGEIHRTGGFDKRQFGSVNWGMLMARRPLGKGWLGLRTMLSVEPWTVSDCGYLNLLATGEMCDGDTIHDRQHPHDLFMELAAELDRPLRGAMRWRVYAGLAGEPALGPAGFPHRFSAMSNPVAPISHHWLDSTHISFGLVTAGVYDRRWKAEVSVFNGREPDAERADLDLGKFDSVSGRLSYLPTDSLSIQVSAAHLHEAEDEFPPDPRSDVNRGTVSATYHRTLGIGTDWAATLGAGLNSGREIIPGAVLEARTVAILLESNLSVQDRHTFFGRAEIVEKPAHDLHAHEYADRIFTVGKLQAGYVRYFGTRSGVMPGIGGTVAVSVLPGELETRYYGRVVPSFGIFCVLHPSRHRMPPTSGGHE